MSVIFSAQNAETHSLLPPHLWRRRVSHGVFDVIPGALHPSARVASSPYSRIPLSQPSGASGMINVSCAMNVRDPLVLRAASLSDKESPELLLVGDKSEVPLN